MNLDGQQSDALAEALKSAYPTYDDLRIFLWYGLNKRLEDISDRDGMDHVMFQVVDWARIEGKVELVLSKALNKKPGNERLIAFSQTFARISTKPPEEDGWLESVVQQDAPFVIPAESRQRQAEMERCVGAIVSAVGKHFGTGFLVGPDAVLTNWHVYTDLIEYNARAGAGILFDVDARVPATAPTVAFVPGDPLDSSPKTDLDFALLRLDGRPGDARGWITPVRKADFRNRDIFKILQHPYHGELAGDQKLTDGVVTAYDRQIQRITHFANTDRGSSGSPCFTPGWDPVAIHHYGSQSGNRAVPLGAILDRSPVLAAMEGPRVARAPLAQDKPWDFYVSFAAEDDSGWVSKFSADLDLRVRDLVSRPLLVGGTRKEGATPRDAKVLVAIVSPGYAQSEECRRERELFPAGRPIVVVRYPGASGVLDDVQTPSDISSLRPYRLPDPDAAADPNADKNYMATLFNIADEVAAALKGAPPAPPAPPGRTVLLAEVTEDLDFVRAEVEHYLVSAGIAVRPAETYPRTPSDFRRQLDADLQNCALFVQLLGPNRGRVAPDLPNGYLGLQLERARELGKPVLQWISRKVDVAAIGDAQYRERLLGPDVHCTDIEEFKSAVVEALPPPPSVGGPTSIYVFVDKDDEAWVEHTLDPILQQVRKGYVKALNEGDSTEMRKDLNEYLTKCRAVLFVYMRAPHTWIFNRVTETLSILAQRTDQPRIAAIYDGPPPPPSKDPIRFRFPGQVEQLNCWNDNHALQQFIARV